MDKQPFHRKMTLTSKVEVKFPFSGNLEKFLRQIPGSLGLLQAAINAFKLVALPYVMVGSLARKCWLDHQEATKDADLMITDAYGPNLREALKLLPEIHKFSPFPNMITLERDACTMKIDIMIATARFDPEESCVHDSVELCLETSGFNLKLAKPEYLAWMLASSPHERHQRDLKRLIHSQLFNLPLLKSYMLYARDIDGWKKISNLV